MDFMTHLRDAVAAYRARDYWAAIRHLLHLAATGADTLENEQAFSAPVGQGAAVCPFTMPAFSSDDEAVAALESVETREASFSAGAAVPWTTILPLALELLKRLLNRQPS